MAGILPWIIYRYCTFQIKAVIESYYSDETIQNIHWTFVVCYVAETCAFGKSGRQPAKDIWMERKTYER